MMRYVVSISTNFLAVFVYGFSANCDLNLSLHVIHTENLNQFFFVDLVLMHCVIRTERIQKYVILRLKYVFKFPIIPSKLLARNNFGKVLLHIVAFRSSIRAPKNSVS